MVFCFYLFLFLSVQNVTGTSGTFRIKFQKTWFFHQLRVEINRQIVISCEFNINRLKTHLFLYCCHVQARWQILPIHHRSGIEEDLTSSKTCQRQQIKDTFISLTLSCAGTMTDSSYSSQIWHRRVPDIVEDMSVSTD